MINLDERPEKYQKCLRKLQPYKIHPYRFSAVNGWKLPTETLNDLGFLFEETLGKGQIATWFSEEDERFPMHEKMHKLGRTYFGYGCSRGMIGSLLSHLSILQDAYDSGYETIWVMEDGIQVHANPHTLSELIGKLDELIGKGSWDILFTDPDAKSKKGRYVPCYNHSWRPHIEGSKARFSKRESVGKNFTKIGARYGSYSYIIRRSGMKKILQFFQERTLYLPYDMEMILPLGIQLYAVTKDIVSYRSNISSDKLLPLYEKIRSKKPFMEKEESSEF